MNNLTRRNWLNWAGKYIQINVENILLILTYIAVIASAISGALEARKNEMDIVGATTIAFATAFGGGTIRDLLLGRTPVFWVLDPGLTIAAFIVGVAILLPP